MNSKIQRLKDFELIQGEYLSLTLRCRRESGTVVDVSSLTSALKVYRYGDRENVVLTIQGEKVDTDKISFKLTSANSEILLNGKFEYIVSAAYSNGDKNMGLGYITIV